MANRRAMKLFAVTILAGASTASASPARQAVGTTAAPKVQETGWAGYIDTSIKPRQIGTRPAPGNTAGGKSKGGMRRADEELDDDRPQARRQEPSLKSDLTAFDTVMQQIERLPDAPPVTRVAMTAGAAQPRLVTTSDKPMRILGLTDKQLAELEPIDLAVEKIDLRVKTTPEQIVIRPRKLANARPACGNTGGKSDGPAADCSLADISLAAELDKWEIAQANKRVAKMNSDAQTLFTAAQAVIRANPSLKARLLVDGRPACGNTQGKTGPESYCRIGDE